MDLRAVTLSLLSLAAINFCQADSSDIITSLPGLLKQPSFDMFSGYLKGTGSNQLHYWFINSQHATTDPLIIWLSDGPGCSALNSLLTSSGPFRVQPDGVNLAYNPSSWNQNANVLYIDAPTGTGFSYSSGSAAASSDTSVTEDYYQALLSFFTKYPDSTLNNIYLFGSGYGGVYAPLLLQKIDSASPKLPLTFSGLAVGNPLTNLMLQDNALVYYAYNHGIIGENLWSQLKVSCCSKEGACNFHNNTNKNCILAVSETLKDLVGSGINPFKVNGDCSGGVPAFPGRAGNDGFYHYSTGLQHVFLSNNVTEKARASMKGIPRKNLRADLPCVNATAITKYLSSDAVRSALHISDDSPAWQLCNAAVDQHYTREYTDMANVYTNLLSTFKYRVLIYNGDQDATYSFLGNEWFVTSLHRQEEVQWRPWLFKSALSQNQVAGFVKEYTNIAFLTIKNAGFWPAQDQPLATGLLVYNFINKRPF